MSDVADFDIYGLKTPYYAIDERLIEKNLELLESVSERSGCKILLAQKAFSMFCMYPLVSKYLSGSTASGLYEAKLGAQEMGGETHVFSAAYTPSEMDEILEICDHVIFNSFSEWERYRQKAIKSGKECGIRLNPEHSTGEHGMYDPCAKGSRMGVTLANFRADMLEGISGFHFHTLCEQNSDDLVTTLDALEEKFGKYFYDVQWVNFGGGHHITREDYDIEALIRAVVRFREKYDVKVYLEPGEAIALNAGFLVASVLDITKNDIDIAILDASAACHMPDVLEVPYRPRVIGSGEPKEKPYTYRFGAATCLSGDIIGDYSFDEPLKVGDRIVFCDMAIYSMVKNNTFNGMKLPTISRVDEKGQLHIVKEFGYEDFKMRLS